MMVRQNIHQQKNRTLEATEVPPYGRHLQRRLRSSNPSDAVDGTLSNALQQQQQLPQSTSTNKTPPTQSQIFFPPALFLPQEGPKVHGCFTAQPPGTDCFYTGQSPDVLVIGKAWTPHQQHPYLPQHEPILQSNKNIDTPNNSPSNIPCDTCKTRGPGLL